MHGSPDTVIRRIEAFRKVGATSIMLHSIQFNDKGDVPRYPRVYVIGEDLALYDHTERVRKQKEIMKARREELRRQLEKIQQQARELDN